jgi:hypothetical protein
LGQQTTDFGQGPRPDLPRSPERIAAGSGPRIAQPVPAPIALAPSSRSRAVALGRGPARTASAGSRPPGVVELAHLAHTCPLDRACRGVLSDEAEMPISCGFPRLGGELAGRTGAVGKFGKFGSAWP